MNRRNRTLAVLFIAVLLASAASYAVYRAISRMPVRQVEVATVHIAVASENLPTGIRLAKEHVKVVGWPASTPVKGSFASADQVIGRGLIQPVSENEPLTENKLAPIEAGAGLPPSIPPGMRALSIRVNDVISVAGYTVPGTKVDVLVTVQEKEQRMSRTVLSNVQVLAAGTVYDQERAKDGKPIPTSVVTLLLTPEDAEKITLAQSSGSITLVLRNPLDVEPTKTQGVRTVNLMGTPGPQPVVKADSTGRPRLAPRPKPAVLVEAPPKIYSVEAIRAAKRSDEVVK